ncbi:MAG: hypothetical protein M5R40_06625 [Anaerolineae bacterium]|nr:hypothetical protein [Anaerolineae bacterium]
MFVGRVRKPPAAGVLYVNETSRGDTGYPTAQQKAFADNQHVTVLATFDLWYAFPRIVEAGPDNWVFYKDYDAAFVPGASGQGAQPPPVANIGPFRPGFADPDTGVRVLDFNSSASFAVAPGASVASRLWDFADGTPDSSVEINPEGVAFPDDAAFRWVTCQVTDTNGKTHAARAGVWTHSDAHPPLRVVGVEGDTRDRTGRRMSVALHPADAAALHPGALVCYWEDVAFGGQALPAASTVFVGWVVRHRARITPSGAEIVLDLEGPGHLLQRTAAVTQRVEAAASPADWTQVTPNLCHHDGVAWYLLHWHCPALLELFDFHWSGATTAYRRQAFALPMKRLGAQLDDVCARIAANFGADSAGALWLRQNPLLMRNVDRAVVATRMALDAGDWLEVEGVEGEHRRRVHSVFATGFYWDGAHHTALQSLAPGRAQGQGADAGQLEGMTVTGPVELNRWAGHEYARLNNPYPNITLKLRPYDVFEPAHMEWVSLTVPADRDPLGVGFAAKRCLPHGVSVAHDRPRRAEGRHAAPGGGDVRHGGGRRSCRRRRGRRSRPRSSSPSRRRRRRGRGARPDVAGEDRGADGQRPRRARDRPGARRHAGVGGRDGRDDGDVHARRPFDTGHVRARQVQSRKVPPLQQRRPVGSA